MEAQRSGVSYENSELLLSAHSDAQEMIKWALRAVKLKNKRRSNKSYLSDEEILYTVHKRS